MKKVCNNCHAMLYDTEECHYCGSRYNTSGVGSVNSRPDLLEFHLLGSLGYTAHHHLDDVNNCKVMPHRIPLHQVWYSRGNLHVYYDSVWYLSEWREGQLHVLEFKPELNNLIKTKKWQEVTTNTNSKVIRVEIS